MEIKSRVRAFTTGDGKMAAIQILKFETEDDADSYSKAWNGNSSFNNRRSTGLNDVKFVKVGETVFWR